VLKSSDRIAEAKTGSIWIVRATCTGREGPDVSRNSSIFFFFSVISIMWFRNQLGVIKIFMNEKLFCGLRFG